MKTITKLLISGAVLWAAMSVSMVARAQTSPPSEATKWGPFLDLEGKAGTKRNLGTGDLFVPFLQNSTSMLFADIRGRFDDHSDDEGNFGLGVRHMLSSGWNVGTYGFYDRRKTELGSTFGQATFGIEALSLDWDLRANFYQPVGASIRNVSTSTSSSSSSSSTSTNSSSAAVSGTAVQVTTTTTTTTSTTTSTTTQTIQDVEQKGFDAEIGWRVPVFAAEGNTQLRVYAGGYRFYASNTNATQGPRGRIDLTVYQVPHLWEGARLDLGTEVQNDGPRGTQAFAEARLRIPLQVFGKPSAELTALERRMEDPIVRDVDIVDQSHATSTSSTATNSSTSTSSVVETATQTSDGSAFTVLNSSTTTGAQLQGSLNTAGANSTVLLSGSFNTTSSGTLTLQSGQTLTGALTVKTSSGFSATVNTGASITGNVGAANYTITMAGNSTLSSMTINNTNNSGGQNAQAIVADGVTNAKIMNNTINVTMNNTGTAHGIDIINAASNVTVSGNTITATGSGGASIVMATQVNGAAHPSVTITNNTLSASGGTTENATVDLSQANILSGSSGNTAAAGSCHVSAAGTGSTVTFTNAGACGP